MTNKRNQFIVFKDENLRHNFNKDLLKAFERWNFSVISVLIDKKAFTERYFNFKENPYHYCLKIMMERYCHFLKNNNAIGDVMIESRTPTQDLPLTKYFRHLYENGTNYIGSEYFSQLLTSKEIKIRKKNENISGLQISDLIAIPLRNRILEKYRQIEFTKENYGKEIFDIIKNKIYKENNTIWGFGLKFLP